MFDTLSDFFLYDEKSPMIFTTPTFWYFFAFVMLVYQMVYKNINLRNFFLMVVSMFFYYKGGGFFIAVLVFSTILDYQFGKIVYNAATNVAKKRIVVISVIVNLTILAYFKYTFFLADTINFFFSTELKGYDFMAALANTIFGTKFDITNILLPVGISFYTFQSMSYVIDIYRGELKPVENIWDYAFFVSFFPQLVAGPIVRASDFAPQMYEPYRLTHAEYGRALFLIINGLVKKILISDYLSLNFVDRVFSEPLKYSGFENLLAVYGYSLQIYCDFSGYTDIAIGVALLLGFRLNLNFNSPYKAQNITDFWRRWHISLSTWLRDYLYISLGGNRHGRFRTYLNLFLTMFLGGLWHGASVRFVIWGALHGIALGLHKVFMEFIMKRKPNTIQVATFGERIVYGFITFHFVAFCWIFFRAETMQLVGDMLSQITTNFQPEIVIDVITSYYKIILIMLLGFVIHWLPTDFKVEFRETFITLPEITKAIIIVGIMLVLFQVRSSEVQPFIYFQF
jgi:D-alanyl-lipoteichoic acid acyltransferase DltB (MBOAT superfamily)